MKERKLLDFILGNLSANEESRILSWIKESEDNRKKFYRLKNTLALSKINYDDYIDKEFLSKEADKITGAKRRKLMTVFLRYAAAVIMTAGITSVLYISRINSKNNLLGNIYHNVIAPPGQKADVKLADGSHILLNSESVLTYPANFAARERNLTIEGEAYFDVQANEKKPFKVTVGELEIVVTGTAFNVDSYPRESEINITLVDGSAEIRSKTGSVMASLAPGENARFDIKTNRLIQTKVDTDFYTSWQKGIIKFSNRRIEDIAQDLERWYNVEIIFDSERIKDLRFSGAILKNKPIDQVLEIIKLTSNFNYEISIDDDKESIITIKE